MQHQMFSCGNVVLHFASGTQLEDYGNAGYCIYVFTAAPSVPQSNHIRPGIGLNFQTNFTEICRLIFEIDAGLWESHQAACVCTSCHEVSPSQTLWREPNSSFPGAQTKTDDNGQCLTRMLQRVTQLRATAFVYTFLSGARHHFPASLTEVSLVLSRAMSWEMRPLISLKAGW